MLNLFIQLENAEKILIKVPNITERLIQYQKIKQAVRHQGFKLSAFLPTIFLQESEGVGSGMKAVLNHPLKRENNKEFRSIIRKNFKIN